ncbi:class I SAM-dependent methyltransferase [Candidatus Woesearchaeota archaeon]|nr:class I SAM-dependent methyltransferase [Candidatus Woesearchaeota archaeon]
MEAESWDRIAEDYFEEIGSPFSKGVDKKLFNTLRKLKDKSSIIDLGCGIGNLEPFLSRNFKSVTAIDFSSGMLKHAKKRCKDINNIRFAKKDLRNLKGLYNKFDVAVAVNSILMPSIKDINKILKEIKRVIKKAGTFIGVFPSINSDLYRAMLTYERELSETKNRKLARQNTYTIIGKDTYDFLLGIFNNKGKQKHYYKFELEYRLSKAGFRNIKISKLFYPWEMCVDDDIEFFKDKQKLWDWFVVAEKR